TKHQCVSGPTDTLILSATDTVRQDNLLTNPFIQDEFISGLSYNLNIRPDSFYIIITVTMFLPPTSANELNLGSRPITLLLHLRLSFSFALRQPATDRSFKPVLSYNGFVFRLKTMDKFLARNHPTRDRDVIVVPAGQRVIAMLIVMGSLTCKNCSIKGHN
ncbi:hypothetical protein SARC_04630, partial [Sphaeroforma arctica JP610]